MVLSRVFSWDDFYFTGDDYRLRIKPPLLDRYADLLREQFNSGVMYCGKRLPWDTLILRVSGAGTLSVGQDSQIRSDNAETGS